MVDKSHLQQALKDLGFTCQEGKVEVFGLEGVRTAVEFKIKRKNPDMEVGFRRAGDAYEVVADWEGFTEEHQRAFVQKIAQRYAYNAARKKLEEQGFNLASEEVQQDGRIHLVLRRTT